MPTLTDDELKEKVEEMILEVNADETNLKRFMLLLSDKVGGEDLKFRKDFIKKCVVEAIDKHSSNKESKEGKFNDEEEVLVVADTTATVSEGRRHVVMHRSKFYIASVVLKMISLLTGVICVTIVACMMMLINEDDTDDAALGPASEKFGAVTLYLDALAVPLMARGAHDRQNGGRAAL